MSTTPRNAQEANQQAVRFARAKQLREEGYSLTDELGDGTLIAVCKPGRLAASYWIQDGECDCPDAMKGNRCKHEMAWQMIEAEAELEALEAQAARWEMEEANV